MDWPIDRGRIATKKLLRQKNISHQTQILSSRAVLYRTNGEATFPLDYFFGGLATVEQERSEQIPFNLRLPRF